MVLEDGGSFRVCRYIRLALTSPTKAWKILIAHLKMATEIMKIGRWIAPQNITSMRKIVFHDFGNVSEFRAFTKTLLICQKAISSAKRAKRLLILAEDVALANDAAARV
jgi:hypothetical protein